MKVLYFTKYTRLGASSRLRSFQYFPYLHEQGIEINVSSLFNEEYLKQLYNGSLSKADVIKGYIARFLKLFSVWKYDKIVIEYELFPFMPAWAEMLLSKMGVKYIVDYDDAIFHNYDLNESNFIKFLLADKIDNVMKFSSISLVGNSYLFNRAKSAGAHRVEILPTVVDLKRYTLNTKHTSGTTVIGWIGSPSSFKCLKLIFPVLEKLVEKYNVEVHIVGSGISTDDNKRFKYITWEEETEVSEINKFDIGVMPLIDSPWERGKCAYKLIQYMACGLPVIATPIGMNCLVVKDGENGFLVENNEAWFLALEKYILNAELRMMHGRKGRDTVSSQYCLNKTEGTLADILSS